MFCIHIVSVKIFSKINLYHEFRLIQQKKYGFFINKIV